MNPVFAPLNIVRPFAAAEHAGRSGSSRPRPDRHGLSHHASRPSPRPAGNDDALAPLATGAVGEPQIPLARLRSRPYADLVKILYLAITGASDPTRASIALHIAANGSVETGQECAVVLAGDATELVSRGTAERVEGVGVPPVKELFQKLLDHQVPVYV